MRSGAVPLAGLIVLSAGLACAQTKKTGAILPGGDSKKPINIEAGKLDYFDKEQKLIYTGNVVARQGDSTLKSSVLTIFLAPKTPAKDGAPGTGGSTNQVQHMIADGPVTMLQRDQVGTGDHAVYDKAANDVVMTGNVVLTQGENVTKGDKLVYDLKTGHATVSGGRVFGMFKPSNDATAVAPDPAPAGDAPLRNDGRRASQR